MAEAMRDLLRDTLSALEHFDVQALEQLLARAQQMSAAEVCGDALQAAKSDHKALADLLASTERNLKTLRRLRGEDKAEWVL